MAGAVSHPSRGCVCGTVQADAGAAPLVLAPVFVEDSIALHRLADARWLGANDDIGVIKCDAVNDAVVWGHEL